METKIWFVTGASQGFGLALVKALLERGYRVAATSRSVEELEEQQMRAIFEINVFATIEVTVVGPSGFRTGFLTAGSLVATESRIADYRAVAQTQARYAAMNGKQEGDPEKAAALLIELGENPEPPLRLWLGVNAVERVGDKLAAKGRELAQWKELSVSADY